MAVRYTKLLELIDKHKPQTIVETGVWNGKNAKRMINQASKYHDKPMYVGYDLFEDATQITDKEEFNVKAHAISDRVLSYLKEKCPNAEINLVKGNTRNTLKYIESDFAFIDGGHSLETIRHDYEMLKGSKVVVFDDYYTPDENGVIPDIEKVGCNKLVDTLKNVTILTSDDKVITGGYINLAVVVNDGE